MAPAFRCLLVLLMVIGSRASSSGFGDEYGIGGQDEAAQAGGQSAIPRLDDLAELDQFLSPQNEDELWGGGVIGIFSAPTSPQAMLYESLARQLKKNGIRCASAVGKLDINEKYRVKDGWKIMVHPPQRYVNEAYGDKLKFRFGGSDLETDAGKAALKLFVLDKYLPLVSRIVSSVRNERIFVERGLPVFVVITKIDEERDPKGAVYIANRVRKIASKYRGKALFALIDLEDADSTSYFKKDFFKTKDAERIVGIKDGKNYHVLENTFSVETGEKFLDDFFQGKLKPSFVNDNMEPLDEAEGLEDPYGEMGGMGGMGDMMGMGGMGMDDYGGTGMGDTGMGDMGMGEL